MKKFISGILCFVMFFSLAVPTFAAGSNDTLITYENESSYEVSIPAEVSINSSTGKGTINVSVLDVNLDVGENVNISVISENYSMQEDGYWAWKLINNKDSSKTLRYTVKNNGVFLASGADILDTTNADSVSLNIDVLDGIAGSYSDTLTFISEVKSEDRYTIESYLGNPQLLLDDNGVITVSTDGLEVVTVSKLLEDDTEFIEFTKISDGIYSFSINGEGAYKVWLDDVPNMGNNDYMFNVKEYSPYKIEDTIYTDWKVSINSDGLVTIDDQYGYTKLTGTNNATSSPIVFTKIDNNTWTFQTEGESEYDIMAWINEEDIGEFDTHHLRITKK